MGRARSRRSTQLGGRLSIAAATPSTTTTATAILTSSSSGYGGSSRQYGYSSGSNINNINNNKNILNNNNNNNQYAVKSLSLTAGSWSDGVAGLLSGPGPPPLLSGIRPRSKSRGRLSVNTNNGLATIWPDRNGIWLPP